MNCVVPMTTLTTKLTLSPFRGSVIKTGTATILHTKYGKCQDSITVTVRTASQIKKINLLSLTTLPNNAHNCSIAINIEQLTYCDEDDDKYQ